jgi:hypothetical protein
MLPRTVERIMHPTNNSGRIRFYNKMLMMEETIRGSELNGFDNSPQLSNIGI